MRNSTKSVLLLAVAIVVGACSILNREGPDASCADLQNGAANACADGIIAMCTNGTVTYKVCDEKSACSAPWQTSGRYRCTETEPSPSLVAAASDGDGGPGVPDGNSPGSSDVKDSGSGVPGPTDAGNNSKPDASDPSGADAGPNLSACETCVESKCSAQLTSCLGDGSCNAAYQCLLACTDKTCGNLCIDTAAKASASFSIRSCVGGGGVGSGCTAQCPAWP